MNKIYRLIWNGASRAWAAVSEYAKGRGKRTVGISLLDMIGSLSFSKLLKINAVC